MSKYLPPLTKNRRKFQGLTRLDLEIYAYGIEAGSARVTYLEYRSGTVLPVCSLVVPVAVLPATWLSPY
jgi:hypothetical protein